MHKQDENYILAVSGGIDSVVLLHILASTSDKQFVVAHFDHGIRSDSYLDAEFVRQLAKKYKLSFETERVELGADASEDLARQVRYKFLQDVKIKYNAQGIILAHHQDDAQETAIINLLRGTNRKGLSSLKSSGVLVRPMLGATKQQIISYAKKNNLQWREDSTNQNQKYLRNYVRHTILPSFDNVSKQQLNRIIQASSKLNIQIDELLNELWPNHEERFKIKRYDLIMLSPSLAKTILAHVLVALDSKLEVNKQLLQKILLFVKVAKPNKQFLLKNISLKITNSGYLIVEKHQI